MAIKKDMFSRKPTPEPTRIKMKMLRIHCEYWTQSILFVPRVGIEPTRPKTHDFESCASTNSATKASVFL